MFVGNALESTQSPRSQFALAYPPHLTQNDVNSVCKILRSNQCVQLIVFFAPIREILKREIYRADKQCFLCNENKGLVGIVSRSFTWNHESVGFGL